MMIDLEKGGRNDISPSAAASTSSVADNNRNINKQDKKEGCTFFSLFAFDILSSERYVTFLRLAQYLACICLALTLFVDEFFPSEETATILLAEQFLFYVGVVAPTFLIHAPLYVGFLYTCLTASSSSSPPSSSPSPESSSSSSLPEVSSSPPPSSSLRVAIWRRFHKHILAEGAIVSAICFVLTPIDLYCSLTLQKSTSSAALTERLHMYLYITALVGSSLSVMLYFFAVASFRHYKNEIIALLKNTDKTVVDQWVIVTDSWSLIQKNGAAGPYKILFAIMLKFPVSSSIAWVSTILYTSCLPLQGLSVGYTTQVMAKATPESSFWELFQPGLLFLLASAGMAVFLYTMKLGFASLNTSVEEYFRLEMTRSVCFNNKTSIAAQLDTGDLSSRYSRDIALIANFIDKNKLFSSAGILASSIIVLFVVDWRMGFFFFITCPALIIMLAEKPGQAHKAGTLAAARLQGRFQNCVELRRIMDLYSAGDFVYTKSATAMKEDIQVIGHSKWVAGHFVSLVHATGLAYTSLISLAFILFSIPLAKTSDPTLAVNHLAAALVILSQLKSPFSQIGQGVEHWLSIAPALVRLSPFCFRKSGGGARPRNSKSASSITSSSSTSSASFAIEHSLELRNVGFRYDANAPNVLNGVNAKLETGKYTCLVGGSGAGKSTLLNILTRELHPTVGSILVDNHEVFVADVDDAAAQTSKYREQMAIVFQSATFLDGTIAENIRLGKPNATDEQVAIAAERAQCTAFLKDFPDGLETRLGGSEKLNLSGGQGQRVCLARALVRNPRLLILDESTSALDPHTEEEAVKTFIDLAHKENVAVVSVTHRLDTTDQCDTVLVLKDGVVAEEGSPHDLLQRQGLYYEMRGRKSQSKDIDLVDITKEAVVEVMSGSSSSAKLAASILMGFYESDSDPDESTHSTPPKS